MLARLTILSAALLGISLTSIPAAQAGTAREIRLAALGDLASYRAITEDILTLASKSDIAAAQKRGTDLETAWDNAEDKLKPTDPTRWRVVDKAIDRVLNELRGPQPKQPSVVAAVKDLLGTMDKGGAA